jgi:hypothetical protein
MVAPVTCTVLLGPLQGLVLQLYCWLGSRQRCAMGHAVKCWRDAAVEYPTVRNVAPGLWHLKQLGAGCHVWGD